MTSDAVSFAPYRAASFYDPPESFPNYPSHNEFDDGNGPWATACDAFDLPDWGPTDGRDPLSFDGAVKNAETVASDPTKSFPSKIPLLQLKSGPWGVYFTLNLSVSVTVGLVPAPQDGAVGTNFSLGTKVDFRG